jgi:zinc protease
MYFYNINLQKNNCMKKIILALSLVTTLVSNTYAQEATFVTSVEGIKEYSLANGMKVLLIPDAAQSNVIVNIVYGVGSRHEGYGESGMAHLLEHMLFKRSSKFTDIKKTIADKGAQANGTTYTDRTNYYEILPATEENLKWALEMESDRMVTSAILQTDLDTEFSVVRNEFEIGENYPFGVLFDRVLSTSYLWHNYGKSSIGSKEDIELVPASRLKVFYQKYYQPNNATLIIGGKFDEKKTLSWISQYFAPIPKSKTEIEQTYTVEPPQDGERFVELKRNGDIQYLAMAYHTPCYSDKEYAANNALTAILINNPSGILYKSLVETKLATNLSCYTPTFKDPGYSLYSCEIAKDNDINVVQKVFLETMNTVPKMTFTEEDLKRAKNELLKQFENTYNKTINLSVAMTEYVGAGDWRLFFIDRDNVEALTVADIQNAAKKYYLQSNRTWGRFIPETTSERTKVNQAKDIPLLVNGYKGKAMEANTNTFETSVANITKSTEEGKLASGGKYALLEKPAKGNKIEARLILRMGDEKSLSQKSMLADLTARMLKMGTKTRSKKDINDQLDQYKINLTFSGSVDGLFVRVSTDKPNLTNALNLVQDILRNPSFDPAEFEKVKLEAKSELESNRNDPQFVSSEVLTKTTQLYPKNHPYYTESVDESLASLNKATIDDVKNFYQDFYGGSNSISSFVGGIDKPAIKSFLSSTFDNWSPKNTYKRIPTQYFETKTQEKTIQINDKTNAALMAKINLNIGETNPDYPAVDLANELLGGGSFLSSRIPQRLRESEGLSYGAGSYLHANAIDPTTDWGIYAFYNPTMKEKLSNALNDEIQKALAKGFTKEEFDNSLKSWLQNRQTMLGMDEYLVYKLRENLDLGKSFKDYEDYETKVKALNVQKVNAALVKYFDPKKLVIVNSGDFTKK